MKRIFTLCLLTGFILTAFSQDFKHIKPLLTDSTKVIKTEIDTKNQFERIYYINYSKFSQDKKTLTNFGSYNQDISESIGLSYFGILKNVASKPAKFDSTLPEKWVRIFKYKGDWVLFNDIPKFVLTDSCIVTLAMDDPIASVISDYNTNNNRWTFRLLNYNWENPNTNLKSSLEIKVLDSRLLITLWKFDYQGEVSYNLMVPVDKVPEFPIMVMLETDMMDDEDAIFDKVDYEKLWKK